MYRALLLFSISITLITLTSSYVPVKGGRHSIKLKDESTTTSINHNEAKHNGVIYPIIIENQDLTPNQADNDRVSLEVHGQDGSQKDNTFKSILEDTNKTAIQEHNHKSTSFNNNRQEELEINQSRNDSSVSHTENHHMKNGHEEQHIYKKVNENFHRDEVTSRTQVVFNNGANFDQNTQKNHAENEHKISINEDQHKVSMSNLDGKNVEHKHNEHFLHVSNIDNPSTYHIEQHTSFDGVKIDEQQNVARDHQSKKVDIEVPFVTGSFDVQEKVDSNFNVFEKNDHHSNVGITFDSFDQNLNVGVQNTENKKINGVFQENSANNGFEGNTANTGNSNAREHHDDKGFKAHTNQHFNADNIFNSHDQKHVVSSDEKNHNHGDKTSFNINTDLKDIKKIVETEGNLKHNDKSLLDSVVGATVTGGSNKNSIDKKINDHTPGPSVHYGTESHHRIPFPREHHGSFEKHDFEHHHPMFEGHHHDHHFYHSHEFEDSSEECSDEHDKFEHPSPHYHHHHHSHHFSGPHDFHHSKHHIKTSHVQHQ